ncbi:hypothetical protein [Streptomyces sp. RFCAC02]|uniref:hypothetical protein n=1 Tax=Streptomyces sp. RFCAC02 TaxID=2499143 RepID=UPI0010205FF7|nr:hypothetical protein [Streptomyces sp. RFCAC02]
MTHRAAFESVTDMEALLRAAVLFKFEGGTDAEPYVGSPAYARALDRLLDAVVTAHREEGRGGTADRWAGLYRLSGHAERAEFVRRWSRRHPRWEELDDAGRREWLGVLAAPYRLGERDVADLLG